MKMTRYLAILLAICALVVLSACTAPPEEVPRAEIPEEDATPPSTESDVEAEVDIGDAVEVETSDEQTDTQEDGTSEVASSEDLTTVPINAAKSTFTFIGYGPGKSHDGTFDEMRGILSFQDGKLVGAEGVILADSVNTGIGGLDNHLKADDFFDVERYPEIKMRATSIEHGEANAVTVKGDLTFHGVTEEVTFPATAEDQALVADFVLDTTPFGMTNAAVNKEVRIQFTLTG